MNIQDILALDFDGVLCDGMREYFEASRRTYVRVWPDEQAPGEELFPAFGSSAHDYDRLGDCPAVTRPRARISASGHVENWEGSVMRWSPGNSAGQSAGTR